jgi:hypothetical protein
LLYQSHDLIVVYSHEVPFGSVLLTVNLNYYDITYHLLSTTI